METEPDAMYTWCALNTLVDIALTTEISQLKKNDHSYSTHQKSLTERATSIRHGLGGKNNINGDETTQTLRRDITGSSQASFPHIKCKTLHEHGACATIDKNVPSSHAKVSTAKEPMEASKGSKVKNNSETPDHTYASGVKKIRSSDFSVCTDTESHECQSAEKLCTPEEHAFLVSTNKKCISDEQIHVLNESYRPTVPNTGCFTLPRAASRRNFTARGEAPGEIMFTVTSLTGDGKNDHTYARHKWQDISEIMSTMSDDINGQSATTLNSLTDHCYGIGTSKPIKIKSTVKDPFGSEHLNWSHGFNADYFTLLNIGSSSKDHTNFGSS